MILFHLMGIKKGPAWARNRCVWVFSPEVKSDPRTQDSRAGRTQRGTTVASLGGKRGMATSFRFHGTGRPHLMSAPWSALLDPCGLPGADSAPLPP